MSNRMDETGLKVSGGFVSLLFRLLSASTKGFHVQNSSNTSSIEPLKIYLIEEEGRTQFPFSLLIPLAIIVHKTKPRLES